MGEFQSSIKYRDTLEKRLDDLKNTLSNQIAQTQAPAKTSEETSVSEMKKVFKVIASIFITIACSPVGIIGSDICDVLN